MSTVLIERITTVDKIDDHDHDLDKQVETSPVVRVEIIDPPNAVHTRLVCARGGIEIWAEPDGEELS